MAGFIWKLKIIMSDRMFDLNGLWKFQPDQLDQGVEQGFPSARYDVLAWPLVRVPAVISKALPDMDDYTGRCWFAREFVVPYQWKGRRLVLRFEGVNYRCKVWCNGEFLGEHLDGFLRFEFPVHHVMRWDTANTVMIQVDNASYPEDVPGPTVGWRPFCGILRDVRLVSSDLVHADNITIHAEPSGLSGAFVCLMDVVNDSIQAATVQVAVDIIDVQKNIIASLKSDGGVLNPISRRQTKVEGVVDFIRPWSPDNPALYTAVIKLSSSRDTEEVEEIRFGFRKIEARSGLLLLNGRATYLTGFNRHEDTHLADMCSDPQTVRQDLMDMKAMGCNFVRLCHYPHDPAELDLCDELGLLVKCEVPLWQWKGDAEGHGLSQQRIKAARRQLESMIRRDRNHPSIIIWSVSNEAHDQRLEVAAGNYELVRHVRTLDATRLVTHVSDHWFDDARFDEEDIISLNGYPVLYHEPRCLPWERSVQKQWWIDHLERVHKKYPGKPILVSEFGTMAIRGLNNNYHGEDAQAEVVEAQFTGMQAPYVCGAAVWCYADHAWAWPWGTISLFGVVSRDRSYRKKAYYALRKLFTETRQAEAKSDSAGSRTSEVGFK